MIEVDTAIAGAIAGTFDAIGGVALHVLALSFFAGGGADNNLFDFNPTTGVLTFKDALKAGNYNVQVRATDNLNNVDVRNFVVTINANPVVLVTGFVTRLYEIALGRAPSGNEDAEWIEKLLDLGTNGAEVAHGFFFSQEFINKNQLLQNFAEAEK